MGAGKEAWGWYPTGKVWVPLQVAINGKLVIDPTAIFEEPPTNGEMEKGATSNWCFDHNADPDRHHDEAHTLASHTTKAHAELSDAPANAHHTAFTPADHTAIGDAAPHHVKYTNAEAVAAVAAAGYGKVTAGSYIGDGTVNRAIPHGLGVIPKLILITGTGPSAYTYREHTGEALVFYDTAAKGRIAVTAPGAANFYVGNAISYPNSANDSGTGYAWVAFE